MYGRVRTRSLHFASPERIPGEPWQTGTHREMIDHLATGISAAHAWTRIPAVLIETGQVTLAVPIDDALGFAAVHVGITHERWYARTFGYTVNRRANSILATR